MDHLLQTAADRGILPEGFAPATGEQPLAVAEDANEAIFAFGAALAKTRTPRGYMRPEHAFAVAYALGCFYLVAARPADCDFDGLTACRVHFLGHLSIDQATEDAAEQALYADLVSRAADIALHGRDPGPALVKRLMAGSLTGLLDLSDGMPETAAVLDALNAAVLALDAAGQDA